MTSDVINKRNGQGVLRIVRAGFCSMFGLAYAWKNESAFRQEVMLLVLVVVVFSVFCRDALGWMLMVFSAFLVLISELLNTAIEVLSDRITQEYDEAIKAAKDVASAAVLMSVIMFVLVCVYALLIIPFF